MTVGYGDIYPVTILGKVLGILISFLGVGMVAIPTGRMLLREGDRVFIYTKMHLSDESYIEI